MGHGGGSGRGRCRRVEYRKPGRAARIERLAPLEPRLLMASFVVTSEADSGVGSLRDAILLANATAGSDTILFNIPGPRRTATATAR